MNDYISSVSVTPHFAILKKQAGEDEFSIFQIINYSNSRERAEAHNDGLGQVDALLIRETAEQFVLAHYENGEYKPVTSLISGKVV